MSPRPSMRRLLVTGGSGFLGHEVVRLAAAGGSEVVATHHTRRPTTGHEGVVWVPLDLRDVAAVEHAVTDAFGGAPPDAVVHTAYTERGPDVFAVIAAGGDAVSASAAAAGARLVHVSTDVVFDGTTDRPYREDDRVAPVHDYGRAKAAAEEAVASQHAAAVIVRTSLILRGPGGDGPRSKHEDVVLDAVDGRAPDAVFFTDEWRNPVQVTDLAHALLELAGRPDICGPLHVTGPDTVSRYELARLVAAANGRDPARVRGSSSAALTTPRPRNCALDTGRARALLRTPVRGIREVFGGR